jgi:hypothetical protein
MENIEISINNDEEYTYTNQSINYEINESSPANVCIENTEIDDLLNNSTFFYDFKTELDSFNDDNIVAQHVDYFENYNMKQLHHISNYYQIPKRKLKKDELIELIVQFENDDSNMEIVYNRRRLWHYLMELKDDTYFSKFIIFN